MAGAVFLLYQLPASSRRAVAPLSDPARRSAPGIFSPPEALMAQFKLAMLAGVVLASPVILYQLVAFVYPALTALEKRYACAPLSGVVALFGAGIVFRAGALSHRLRFLCITAVMATQAAISEYISSFFPFIFSGRFQGAWWPGLWGVGPAPGAAATALP